MKKAALLLVIALGIAPAGLALAGPNTSFTDADIQGNYGLLNQGSIILPTTPPVSVPVVIVGTLFSDGKGNEHGKVTVNAGAPVPGPGLAEFTASLVGTYDVDTDGTGDFTAAATITPPATPATNAADPAAFQLGGALVIDDKDKEVRLLSTGSARVLLTTAKKQHPPNDGFSNRTLRGNWGFSCQGTLFTLAADPTAVESPLAVVGLITDDGKGDFSAEVTADTAGVILQSTFSGHNEVASDGTISATATSADPLLTNLRGVIDNKDEFRLIAIDPGKIVSCTARKQRNPDQANDESD